MDNRKINDTQDTLELIDSLKDLYSQEELEKIKKAFSRLNNKGKRKPKQVRKIVPIREWISSEYYLGPFANDLYPYWKEQIINIFESPVRINEVILTGATGIGKTSVANIIMMRKVYELSCYENISSLFPNLSSISRVALAYLSVTQAQAKMTGFHGIRELFDSVPYFREIFTRDENIDSMLVWPQENMFITYGSRLNHFIGLDLLGATLDEANFHSGRETKETGSTNLDNPIYMLYDQVISRAHSRFVTKHGNDSLSIISSSSTIASSFTEDRIKKGLDDPTVYIASPALWDVRPEQYEEKRFYVFAGSDLVDATIVDDLSTLNQVLESHKYKTIENDISIKEALELIPSDIRYKMVSVPEEHRSAFKTKIIYMLQDLAGYSVSASNRFFTSRQAYESCIKDDIKHPFTKEEVVLSTTPNVSNEGYLQLMDYVDPNFEIKNPQIPRYMHLDLALTGDSAGISMVHISGWKRLNEGTQEEQVEEEKPNFVGGTSSAFEASLKMFKPTSGIQIHSNELKLPIITVDFMLRINPPNRPYQISYSKIRDFILWMKFVKKINIQLVTADQFQSAQMLQELSEAGIHTGYLSVDRSPTPYRTLANLIQDGRVNYYKYEPFRRELFALIETRSSANKVKIDHPKDGGKDCSDSVAGSVYNAVTAADKTDTTETSLVETFVQVNRKNTGSVNVDSAINSLLNILSKD